MTAIDTGGGSLGRVERTVHRPRLRSKDSLPAVRDLRRTLRIVLAAAAVTLATALVTSHTMIATVALVATGLLMALAATILRAVTTLTPSMFRDVWTSRRRALRVAVVGTRTSATELQEALSGAGVEAVEVVGAIAPGGDRSDLGTLADIRTPVELHEVDLLLVGSGVARDRVVDAVMRECEGDPVRVCDLSSFCEDVFGQVPIGDVDGSWLQYVLHPQFRERRSQRIADVLVAGALALALLPLLAGLALLIRRDGGPALFRQRRVGRDGRPFVIYKLRTMCWEPSTEAARWAEPGDPRITRFGRLLRRTHVDELPQLFNVLRGEMTLVGPRPEQPEIVERLEERLPLWRGRHRYKPGLTGWAQVRCGYAGSHDGSARKLAHDLYYLRHQSLALDASILALTAARALDSSRNDVDSIEAPVVRRIGDRGRREAPVRPTGAQRALVTGGAGFIGSQLVDRLLDDGFDVVAVDDLSTGRWENLAEALSRGARLQTVDVTAADELLRVFMAERPELVFHLAAQIEVARAVEAPLIDAKANVVGTLSALEAARACGARRFVLASSGGAIYGDATVKPTPEQAPLVPLSPYGTAKLAAEQYTALYNDLYGLSTATLRLANVYGPRQGLSGEGGVIARFCRARVDGDLAQVFGDGMQTRDYVHVRDVVAAFVAAGHSRATGAFNIGTGTETTLLDLLEALELPARFHAARSGEVRRSVLDASAAEQELGWRACTPLQDGLADTLAFAGEIRAAARIAV